MSNIVEPSAEPLVRQIAARVRTERERRRWTLAQLADASGVSPAMISRIERGESSPTAVVLGKLSAAFQLSVASLLALAEGTQDAPESAADTPGVRRGADAAEWRDPGTGYRRRQITGPRFPAEIAEIRLPACSPPTSRRWLFNNGTNLLAESRAPGGNWLWDAFYPAADRLGRGGGFRWTTPQATSARVEEVYDYLASLIQEDLCTRPEGGNGSNLVGVFSTGRVGVTPAGGFWAGGLHLAGMKADAYDVQYFPRWRTQRMQFGAAGYALLRTSKKQDAAWEFIKYAARKDVMTELFAANQTTPARRSMLTTGRYRETGPAHWKVFYDTLDKFPDTGPIPAPPQVAEVTDVLLKYTGTALASPRSVAPALRRMQGDLEQAMEREL
ncbi:extracellular solute-binding protein [Streptomyces sp. NPDC005921]